MGLASAREGPMSDASRIVDDRYIRVTTCDAPRCPYADAGESEVPAQSRGKLLGTNGVRLYGLDAPR